MGAPQNRAERGRVSVQPIYSVNQMPERKEPQVRVQTSAGAPRLDVLHRVHFHSSDNPNKCDVDSDLWRSRIIKDDLNNISEDLIIKVTPQL